MTVRWTFHLACRVARAADQSTVAGRSVLRGLRVDVDIAKRSRDIDTSDILV